LCILFCGSIAVAPIRTHIVIAKEGAVRVDKFRFGVGKGDVAHSSLWVVSQHKNDAYLGVHGQTGHAKVSFHASGWVRFALADRYVPTLATPGMLHLIERFPNGSALQRLNEARRMCSPWHSRRII
jgi:hypothetical protein